MSGCSLCTIGLSMPYHLTLKPSRVGLSEGCGRSPRGSRVLRGCRSPRGVRQPSARWGARRGGRRQAWPLHRCAEIFQLSLLPSLWRGGCTRWRARHAGHWISTHTLEARQRQDLRQRLVIIVTAVKQQIQWSVILFIRTAQGCLVKHAEIAVQARFVSQTIHIE
jgi:hypothetical protein